MCGRHHPWLTFTIVCALLATSSFASAQEWLTDRRRAEGHGILVGDLELHPGIGSEVGYYSNPFYADQYLQPTAALRVAPHLFLSTLGAERLGVDTDQHPRPPMIRFNGGISGTFQHYFEAKPLDVINGTLNGDFTLAPERPIGLHLTEALNRSALPFSDTGLPPNVQNQVGPPNYARWMENAGVQLLMQSSGGLLRGLIGYRFGYNWFEDVGFRYNNNMIHTVEANMSWEFLPKTALFYEASFAHQRYPLLGDPALAKVALTQLVNNDKLMTRLGLNGAITSRLGLTAAVGYAAGFYGQGDEYEGLIGSLEGRATLSPDSQVSLVFDRGFLPAYQGNFQDRERIYARLRWLFGGAFLLTMRGGVEFLKFGRDMEQQNRSRSDRGYFADISGEYRFVDWLAVTAQGTMLIDDTNFVFLPRPGDTFGPNPAKFNAFEAWLGVRAFY